MNKIFILFFSLLTACNSAPTLDEDTGDNPNVAFKIIAKGQHSNISLANQLVIKNRADWLQLLKINGDTSIINKKNSKSFAIDFSDNIVIALFAGQQPTGGYSIGVSHIKKVNDNLFVTLSFTEPNKNDNVSLALSQPYIFLSTEKIDGKVIFLTPKQKLNY